MAGYSRRQRNLDLLRFGSTSLLVAAIVGCQFEMNPNQPATTGESGNSQAGVGGSSSTHKGTADQGEGGSGDGAEGGAREAGNDEGGSDATGKGGATGGASQSGTSSVGSNVGGRASTDTKANGGAAQGGSATGGKAQGGTAPSATGGKAQGGSATGGRTSRRAQGGTATSATGGTTQAGTATSATGGKAQGGSATGGASSGATAPSAVAQEYVDAHNKIRAAVTAPSNYSGTWEPLPNVTWSDEVAASAQKWANHLRDTLNCGLEHEGSGTGLGENLAAGSGLSPTQAVEMWAGEKSSFKYTSPFSYTASAGHYTQLVWRDSIQIGCASATCTRMSVISCRYKPPGNMIGGEIF